MTSLKQQMEELQKQQAILAEKIQEEEERNKKLSQDASIDRLEALIEPITQKLDYLPTYGPNKGTSYRHDLENRFVLQCNQSSPPTKYQSSHMLANEEIFVTLLNIVRKQDARISELELAMRKVN